MGQARNNTGGGGTGANNPLGPERTEPIQPLPTNTDQPPGNPGESVAPDVPQSDLVTRTIKDLIRDDKFTPEMENRLGMTRDEAEQFVKKYEKRPIKPAADEGREIIARPGAEQALDPARKAPEFTTKATVSDSNQRTGTGLGTDTMSGLNEADRLTPPPELRRQWRAYNRNLARPGAATAPPPAAATPKAGSR